MYNFALFINFIMADQTFETMTSCHPVFTRDPSEFMNHLHKEVCVTADDGTTHKGWVYTIDPVSQSVVLVQFATPEGSDSATASRLEVIMGHAVVNITTVNGQTDTHKKELDQLFRPKLIDELSAEELDQRKEKVRSWLAMNRMPVTVDGEVLNISDAAFVEPPYEAENCRSTNEIILGRIQGLIKNIPKTDDSAEC